MLKYFFSPAFFCLLILFSQVGCGTEETQKKSDTFNSIFNPSDGNFRGVSLGDNISLAKTKERGTPKHEDSLGLVYELNLGKDREGSVEYFAPASSRKISSIVLNAFLKNESETNTLYQESENFLREKFGAPGGNFGNFTWGPLENGEEVNLRMHETSRGITLNFSVAP